MAKNVYIGIANLSKRVPTIYVGVANLARKVVRGYIGINNLAKEFYSSEPALIFETKTPGTYTQSLASGLYEITLIGSGGGGAGARSVVVNNHHYAQGGVGGTLQFIAKLNANATVTLTLGDKGQTKSGTFGNSGTSISGTDGGFANITGFGDLTAKAGGGSGAKIVSTSSSGSTRTAGSMGANTISGSSVVEVLINNPTTITGRESTSTGTSRTPSGCSNTNWSEDTTIGKGGDSGWRSTAFVSMAPGAGLLRIKKL